MLLLKKITYILLLLVLPNVSIAQLNADFYATTTSGCGPLVVNFYDASSGSPSSYSWDLAGTPSTLKNPSKTFSAPGTYTITLTIYKGSSSNVETKTNYITVHPSPVVNFNATSPTSGCSPLTVSFADASTPGGTGPNTYSWFWGNFGSGATTSGIFTNPGTQDVTLTVTNSFGCSNLLTKTAYINVLPKPVPNFSSPQTDFCVSPFTAFFNGSATGSGPFTYSWNFGDGSPSGTGASTSHPYTAPPNAWSPKLIVTDANGCKDSVIRNNYIKYHTPIANFTAPTSVCEGTAISVNSTSTPGGGTCTWNFGDGPNTFSGNSVSYVYYTSGTFTITLTYNYAGCISTATKTITVNPKPIVDFVTIPDTVCPASQTIQFVANGSYSTYLWDFGVTPTVTNSSASPSYTYAQNRYYTPKLIVTTLHGCRDTIVKDDYVKIHNLFSEIFAHNLMNERLMPIWGCKPLTIKFADSAFTTTTPPTFNSKRQYPYPIQSVVWNFGDFTPNVTGQFPTHTYTDTGTFLVTATLTTTKGCVSVDTAIVKVGIPPVVDFDATPRRICVNKSVSFTNLTTGPVSDYEWHFGDGAKSTAVNPTHTYLLPDTFKVTLIAHHNGCTTKVTKDQYIIVDSPKAMFSARQDCDTLTKVIFNNLSIGATSYTWFFGDPNNTTSTTTLNPVFHYPSLGTYTVKLATYNSRSGCIDTLTQQIVLNDPYMTLTVNDTAICKGDSVRFNSTLVGRTAYTYNWYVNNVPVNVDSLVNYTHRFRTSTGFHKIKVVITDQLGCVDSIVKNNYIFVSWPTVGFTGSPLVGCIPFNVNFTDTSSVPTGATITNRTWNYGLGSNVTVSGTNSSATYTNRGFYDVKLYITDNLGCKDSVVKPGYIQARKPSADFQVKDTACIGEPLAFINLSGADSAYWDFGDGGSSRLLNPTHSYTQPGSYTIRLIAVDFVGCRDTMIKIDSVTIVKPNPRFTMSDSVSVCPPLLVQFTRIPSTAVSYYWKMGLGNTSSLANPKEFYTKAGFYKVVLIETDRYGCTDSVSKNISLLGYDGAFSYSPIIGCKPLEVFFNAATSNVANLTWDFDDGVVIKSTASNISHIYQNPGQYTPRVIFEDSKGCKSLSNGLEPIKVDGVIPDFIADAPCQYSTVTHLDTSKSFFSDITIWRWTFHDGTTSMQKRPKLFYGAPGNYSVKLFVQNDRGCKDSITKDLTVYGLPDIYAGADTVICNQDSARLTATGGVKYQWNNSSYLSCLDCASPFAYPKEVFSFVVKGTDANGCSNTDTVVVKLKTKVTAITSPDESICRNAKVQLSVSGGKQYQWTPSDGLDDNKSSTPVASPQYTIRYKVVSIEGRCIPDTDYVQVTVHPLPDVTATGSTTIIAGHSAPISATGNLIKRFKWEPGESLNCDDCPDPTASPKRTTEYIVKVYTDFGCVDSDKVRIIVLCDKSQLFIPNTFTPNGDGQNDVFYPRGTGLDNIKSFRIFNRWGEVVYQNSNFKLNDASTAWDGTYKGNILPPDVFMYILEAYCEDGEVMTIKGDISIVR